MRIVRLVFTGLAAVLALTPLPSFAQTTAEKAAAATGAEASKLLDIRHRATLAVAAEQGWANPPVNELEAVTPHQITAHRRLMHYHATAGTLTIRDDAGKPTASVFYVAYVLDGERGQHERRPVTFFYNGGPGSSTVWLHMGSFAPMRVKTANPEFIRPAPFGFGPNNDTLLDKSDLVFIDAIGTGYSRPLGDVEAKAFWGVDQDADAFAKAIMRYVTKNSRWNSPKFLFGESYGTTRSAAVAYQLQDRGMALNGVILLSSILNYGIEQPGYDHIYVSYLPSYATTAWYHHRVPNPPADVAAFARAARSFAEGPYAAALAKGQTLAPAERDTIARQMSAFTGLSPEFLIRANLRVDLNLFRKELLRDQRLSIGRYDSRYTGYDADYDASDAAISGAFIASFSDYVVQDLGFKTEMPYLVSTYGKNGFEWDWKHKAPGARRPENDPDVALDLSAAMRTNPYLHVLSMNGYYDMATPFFATEYDLGHMMLEPAEQKNLEFRYYPSGHMAYLNPQALAQMHADLSQFYDEAVENAASGELDRRPALSNAGPAGGHSPN